MRISVAIISVLMVPAVLASPFMPIQQSQANVHSNGEGTFESVVSYFRNAMKMLRFQREEIEKDADTFDEQIENSISSSNSASYIAYQQGYNYIYKEVNPEPMITDVITEAPQSSFVYLVNPPASSSSSTSSAPAQITASPPVDNSNALTKVQISYVDIYFSQTDSFSIPDLSSFPPDSPFIIYWPDFPDEAPPKTGLPSESRGSV